MQNDRIILHCDCNSFFASVEEMLNPLLKQVPMAVCGDPMSRHGIILAKNQSAKKFNIVTAETVWQAKKKCPQLVTVAPHFDEYAKMHKLLNRLYLKRTDLVEPFGIDESWLDVTNSAHLFGTGEEIADGIRQEVKERFGISVSVGVSFNKIFAKLGSDYKKPDATTVITRENMHQIVWNLSCRELLYAGKSACEKLEKINVTTIGDLALCDEKILANILGKQGPILKMYARGEDKSPVRSFFDKQKPKSVGNGMTFKRNLFGENDLKVAVYMLSGDISQKLKEEGLYAQGINVSMKDPDFKTVSHQCVLSLPTQLESEIEKAAVGLIEEKGGFKKQIRSLTITAINLNSQPAGQLSLFQNDEEKIKRQQELECAVDSLKKKMGNDIINKAVVLSSDLIKGKK